MEFRERRLLVDQNEHLLSFPAVHLSLLNLWPRRFQGNLHLDLVRRTQIGRCALRQR
jgi:hypothetical protein